MRGVLQRPMSDYVGEYIASISPNKSGVVDILKNQGGQRLSQYVSSFAENRCQPLQGRDDLVRIAALQTGRLFGESLAEAMAVRLGQSAVVLTANHHGVDYHPIYVQGTLIYALPELLCQVDALSSVPVIPVFSFGSVSLNNATFPRGILYQPSSEAPVKSFQKIGIFPDSYKLSMVSFAPPLTAKMVIGARNKVEQLAKTHTLRRSVAEVLRNILEEDYLAEEVLEQSSYSDQASLLNDRLWARVFGGKGGAVLPRIIYLEIEAIVRDLLVQCDLNDDNSLACRVLFDRELRREILNHLDGESGCWSQCAKERGTVFFWGVDSLGRRVSLKIVEDASSAWLVGNGLQGESYRFRLSAMEIKQALATGRILPGMFLCFLQVAFARGIRCFGGPWQTTYLPRLKAGLVKALFKAGRYDAWATVIESIPTANFVAGMTVVVAGGEGDSCEAGMAELLAAGGLSASDYGLISNIRVENAILHNYLLNKSLELTKMCCVSNHPQILPLKI